MSSSFLLLLLALFSSLLSCLFPASSAQPMTVSAYSATIYSLYPSTVGITGGATLTLTGVGFMRGEGSTATTDGATVVYVNNVVCPPIDYYNTDNMYVCTVPPSPIVATGAGVASVQMALEGTGYGTFAACADSVTNCRLTYSAANTPVMYDAPLAGTTGSILALQGALYAQYVDQLELRVGAYLCPLDWQLTTTQTPWYSEPLNGNGGRYSIQCQLTEQVAGRYNLTLLVNPPSAYVATSTPTQGYGYAVVPRYAYRVDDNGGLLYTFVQKPSVTAISPSAGGTTGGGRVSISGTSFGTDCTAINVSIAGMPATPISCSMNLLVVQPGAQTDYRSRNVTAFSAAAVGQSGLTHQVLAAWNGAATSSSTLYGGFNSSFATSATNQRVFGVMVAPYTATYTFLANGNGNGAVWMSTSSTSYTALTATPSSLNYSARNDLWLGAGQQSAPVSLTAGQSLFITALYYNTQFALGVRIHNPSSTLR